MGKKTKAEKTIESKIDEEERELLLEEYKNCTTVMLEASKLTWTRFNMFVAFTAALVPGWVLLWSEVREESFPLNLLPFPIAVVGLIISVVWVFMLARAQAIQDYWLDRLPEIEKKFEWKIRTFDKLRELNFWKDKPYCLRSPSENLIRRTWRSLGKMVCVIPHSVLDALLKPLSLGSVHEESIMGISSKEYQRFTTRETRPLEAIREEKQRKLERRKRLTIVLVGIIAFVISFAYTGLLLRYMPFSGIFAYLIQTAALDAVPYVTYIVLVWVLQRLWRLPTKLSWRPPAVFTSLWFVLGVFNNQFLRQSGLWNNFVAPLCIVGSLWIGGQFLGRLWIAHAEPWLKTIRTSWKRKLFVGVIYGILIAVAGAANILVLFGMIDWVNNVFLVLNQPQNPGQVLIFNIMFLSLPVLLALGNPPGSFSRGRSKLGLGRSASILYALLENLPQLLVFTLIFRGVVPSRGIGSPA